MDEKILLLTDSACDLSPELEQRYGIRVLNIPILFEGKSYADRVEITPDEIYEILNTKEELPGTAHLNMVDFAEAYQKAVQEGYNRIIYFGLNSKGSSTFDASLMGKKLFFEYQPELEGKVEIYNIDSLSYSYGYGYPLMLAAERIEQGASAAEIVAFLQEFMRRRELYFAMYTLKFAKRSGRISAAAGFVGEMLGLRPVMTFEDGKNLTAEKVRGDKSVVPKLFELYKEKADPQNPQYVLLMGENPEPAQELARLIEQYNGQKPYDIGKMGVCVAINAGPQIVGISFQGREPVHTSGEVR